MLIVATALQNLAADIIFSDETTGIQFGSLGIFLEGCSSVTRDPIIGTIKFANIGTNFAGATSTFSLDNAIFIDGTASLILTGIYDPTNTYSIALYRFPSELTSYQQGSIYERIKALGVGSVIGGMCSFITPDAINLSTCATNLNIALTTELSQNIVMNGGTITLVDDLICGDGVMLTGSGSVIFNGFNMATGQKDLAWTSTLNFCGARNLVLGASSRDTGIFTFQDLNGVSGHILGNNYTLDLTNGGGLSIAAGSTLELSNIKLKGFGTGRITFGDGSSQLILNNATIFLDQSRTFNSGNFLFNGPCTVVTGSNILTFAGTSLCAVNGAAVSYDTMGYNDANNIQFASEDIITGNLSYLNGGSIKKNKVLWVGNYTVNPSGSTLRSGSSTITTTLDQELVVTPLRTLTFKTNAILNGAGFYVQFARHPSAPLFSINNSVCAKFTNVLLQDFPAQSNRMGTGAQLIFGDGCDIELGESAVLTTTWYFSGQSVLNGNGRTLLLGTGGSLVLRPGAGVFLDNITIQGIKNTMNGGVFSTNIRCMDNTATLSLGNVSWSQSNAFTMSQGNFQVLGVWDITGSTTFAYTGNRACTITQFGTMLVDSGMTFSYAPRSANRDLIVMQNAYATMHLNGATLASTTTGLRLTTGTLIVDGTCTASAYDPVTSRPARADLEAIALGQSDPPETAEAKELTVIFNSGGTLNVSCGKLLYDNIS